jgi:hypothetical protein
MKLVKKKRRKMPYFDDLVMNEIISYCGLKQAEDKLIPGVYVLLELCEYAPYVRGTINNQLYLISRRTEKYAWVSHDYFGTGWSEPQRMKIRHLNGIETLQRGKAKGLPLTPKTKLDVIFSKHLWETLTLEEKLQRYNKMK